MLKKIVLLMLVATMSAPIAFAVNKAYKVYQAGSIVDRLDGKRNKLAEVERGDTVMATNETEAYIAEHESKQGISYLPVEFRGIKGYIDYDHIYPIKLSPQDTLKHIYTKAEGKREAIDRFLAPAIERTINLPVSPDSWMLWMLIFIGGSAITLAVMIKFHSPWLLAVAALLLAAGSIAEVMYLFSIRNPIWFLKPSVVGGWGKAILYFLLMAITIVAQFVIFLITWTECLRQKGTKGNLFSKFLRKKDEGGFDADGLDEEDDDEKDDDNDDVFTWTEKLAFTPVLLGLALMILVWVDYFQDYTLSANTYLLFFASLPVAALCGMGSFLKRGDFLSAVIQPLCFIVSGIGIALSIMHLSILIILIAIVGAVLIFAVMAVLSAVMGVLFGGERVTGYTDDGRKVTGTKDIHGNIKGDDGNTYTIK